MRKDNPFEKVNDKWSNIHDTILDNISVLTIECPECVGIIDSDDQYQCMTCEGGSEINVLEWVTKKFKEATNEPRRAL